MSLTGHLDRSPKHIPLLGESFVVSVVVVAVVVAAAAAAAVYSLVVAVVPTAAWPIFPIPNTNRKILHHAHSSPQSSVISVLDSPENIYVPYRYR